MANLKRIAHIKLKILVYLILPLVVFILITSKSPLIAGIRSFVVLTGSMRPNIPEGSIVFTQKSSGYKQGDVITYQKKDTTVTHRIIEVKNKNNQTSYITKGDANNAPDDQEIKQNEIVGKVAFNIPHIGVFISFLKTLPGFILFIILPAIIFILLEFKNIRKELEKEIEKKFLDKLEKME